MKKTLFGIIVSFISATAVTAHAGQAATAESVAMQNRASMMNVVNRSMDSGMCSMSATRTLRAAVSKMDEMMKAGDFEGAVAVAHETHAQVVGGCGHKYSLAGMGSVTYAGTFNKLDTGLEAVR